MSFLGPEVALRLTVVGSVCGMQAETHSEALLWALMIGPGFSYSEQEGWSILRVNGELDMSTAPRLRQRIIAIVASGSEQLILDLDGVDFMDSTALGVLVGAVKRIRTNNGELRVVCTRENILKLFELTGLNTVFNLYDSVDTAVTPR